MNRSSAVLLAVLLAAANGVQAQTDVVRCVDASGKVTYRDPPEEPDPRCKPIEGRANVVNTPRQPVTVSGPQRSTGQSAQENSAKAIEAAEGRLEAARKALAEQEAVRYGGERNYQRVLDRLKPFQTEVERREKELDALKNPPRR